MKLFDHELATQKVLNVLDKSGLSKEEQKKLLLEMLNDEKGLSNVDTNSKAEIANAAIQGKSIMFVGGSSIDTARINELSAMGKVRLRNQDGELIRATDVSKNAKGFATLIMDDGGSEATRDVSQSLINPDAIVPDTLDGLEYSVAKSSALHRRLEQEENGPVSTLLNKHKNPGDRSPGEQFAVQTQQDLADFVRANQINGVQGVAKAQELVRALIQDLAKKYDATPGQVRYLTELYDVNVRSVSSKTKDEWAVCSAWASAAEFLPDIHEYIEEFERRIARIYWPPTVDSAATLEATLMAVSYCWSSFYAKTVAEWESTGKGDGELIGNLLGTLAANGHDKIALFLVKVQPIKNIGELCDYGLGWLESNFVKLEISHKLAASLCLTDVPNDIEVKAPWKYWSFVIPDGLLLADTHKGKKENYARVFCVNDVPAYLVSSMGRCVGPIPEDRSTAPEDVANLMKLLSSLVKGACLALADPGQYKKNSLSKNEGSFKSKRVGGAPELNNARFVLSAPVQVDLRDVVHAVQRGEKRKGGKLTVQFLVRGHWKNQAHGPQLSLRKRIWIQPFWKGGEETRVLLRNYVVRDAEERSEDGQSDV
jgi:hypothetical protein